MYCISAWGPALLLGVVEFGPARSSLADPGDDATAAQVPARKAPAARDQASVCPRLLRAKEG